VIIGERLRTIREEKKMSQGDIEERSGLLRCYISRVENGHTVPSVETLEKLAHAMEIPIYQIFYDKQAPPIPLVTKPPSETDWGFKDKDAHYLDKVRQALSKINSRERSILLHMASKMAKHQ
jgi:transcriptional regulator with XRE-family HTH domain